MHEQTKKQNKLFQDFPLFIIQRACNFELRWNSKIIPISLQTTLLPVYENLLVLTYSLEQRDITDKKKK